MLALLSWLFLIAAIIAAIWAIEELLAAPLNVPLSVTLPALLAGVAVALSPHTPWWWGVVLFVGGEVGVVIPQALDCLAALWRLHRLERAIQRYYS